MANANQKCAHAGCQCTVGPGQTYCSPSCQQQAQQSANRQQSQHASSGSSQAGARCNCGHAACQHG